MKQGFRGAVALASAAIASVVLFFPAGAGAASKGGLEAKISRNAQGIPSIEADDFKSLGFGYGYAFAQDNICLMADAYLTVRAQRSRYFGPDAESLEGFSNLDSDFFFKRVIDNGVVEELVNQPPPLGPKKKVKQVVGGYVKGYNRYLKKTGVANIPDARCAGQPWVTEITKMDVYRRFYELALYGSSGAAIDGISSAQPPSGPSPRPTREPTGRDAAALGEALDFAGDSGSNGWGLGKDVTKSGGGIVLINPHFPWQGPRRLYQSHLRIPGKLNVSGASLYGVPFVLIGHTRKLSWMHPVSPAYRFTPFELELDPSDPTRYVVDGQSVPMERNDLTVEVLNPDGTVGTASRTLYETSYGPIFNEIQGQSLFGWTNERAYALFDSNAQNLRLMNHFADVSQAQSTPRLLEILEKYEGIPWVHTVASDSKGRAFYADIGSIPNVPDDLATGSCAGELGALTFPAAGLPVLDGSQSQCALDDVAPGAIAPGVFPGESLPRIFRSDYVANQNNSYWLANPEQPLTGFPRIVGSEETNIGLRPRLGLDMIRDRLAGTDGFKGTKFTRKIVQKLLFANRHHGGELWRDQLVAFCNANPSMTSSDGVEVDVTEACAALAGWDLKANLDSRGAVLFSRFMDFFGSGAANFTTPFDVSQPIDTPSGLDTSDGDAEAALADAVADLRASNIPLDAPWGEFHRETRDDAVIPIHGGEGGQGVFNAIGDRWTDGAGYDDITGGSSFIMVTSFEGGCPKDRSLVTYSQSDNPQSKYYDDQTRLYSEKKWVDPPFCANEVKKAAKRVEVVRKR